MTAPTNYSTSIFKPLPITPEQLENPEFYLERYYAGSQFRSLSLEQISTALRVVATEQQRCLKQRAEGDALRRTLLLEMDRSPARLQQLDGLYENDLSLRERNLVLDEVSKRLSAAQSRLIDSALDTMLKEQLAISLGQDPKMSVITELHDRNINPRAKHF